MVVEKLGKSEKKDKVNVEGIQREVEEAGGAIEQVVGAPSGGNEKRLG